MTVPTQRSKNAARLSDCFALAAGEALAAAAMAALSLFFAAARFLALRSSWNLLSGAKTTLRASTKAAETLEKRTDLFFFLFFSFFGGGE